MSEAKLQQRSQKPRQLQLLPSQSKNNRLFLKRLLLQKLNQSQFRLLKPPPLPRRTVTPSLPLRVVPKSLPLRRTPLLLPRKLRKRYQKVLVRQRTPRMKSRPLKVLRRLSLKRTVAWKKMQVKLKWQLKKRNSSS